MSETNSVPGPPQAAGHSFVTPPIAVPAGGFDRADIVLDGVEQAGPSFDGHVFVDHPEADAATPRTAANGYAGAFYVYGHGPAAGLSTPTTRHVIATEAVRAALRGDAPLTVTVVAVPPGPGRPAPLDLRVSIVFA